MHPSVTKEDAGKIEANVEVKLKNFPSVKKIVVLQVTIVATEIKFADHEPVFAELDSKNIRCMVERYIEQIVPGIHNKTVLDLPRTRIFHLPSTPYPLKLLAFKVPLYVPFPFCG